jgi:Cd2+/Zn2+-exporting ATPase/Cu+-exporting ATPase
MDCAECTQHVQTAIAALPGVHGVDVFLASEKAVVALDPERVGQAAIVRAVEGAGYSVPSATSPLSARPPWQDFTRKILTLFGVVFGSVLFIVIVGEWLGLFDLAMDRIPWPVWVVILGVGGYPVFRNVIRAALKGRVISHTLMTVGVVAAIAVGQWVTAIIVVFFMRVGDYAEHFTSEKGRQALRDLTDLAPKTARVERAGGEDVVPMDQVRLGETIVIRPGETIPVDGEVLTGQATIDQSAITGESMPVDVAVGSKVFAASLARLGSVRVCATGIGAETTFGRVIALVEEAEGNRGEIQRVADRFSTYYLPVVAAIATLTFVLRHDPLATAAVLVVACSCSFALATPIAMLASIGAGARRGILVKGGKYLETLARTDVVLVDKTGTLTLGRPVVTDVLSFDGTSTDDVLALATAAERYSEHPLAEAVRQEAHKRGVALAPCEEFEAIPGQGVRARVNGHAIAVGSRRLVADNADLTLVDHLEARGKTTLIVVRDGVPLGVVATADTLRPEVPAALAALRALGLTRIEMLTGDNNRVAAAIAGQLGIDYRASLLPEQKIAVVKDHQAQGHIVVMIGDGVNDAPALAKADVGIAMGAFGSDVAIEAAHVALMRDDWTLVPEVFQIARRTMRIVTMNLIFTTLYNLVGLSLAAFGFLPPVVAAAAQSLPDIGILGNSARLLRQKQPVIEATRLTRPALPEHAAPKAGDSTL